MNGRSLFVFDWSNGKVVSRRAYRMLKDDESASIAEENLISLNPEDDSPEEDLLKVKMEGRRARIKAAKKAAKTEKRKAIKIEDVEAAATGDQEGKKAKVTFKAETKQTTKKSSASTSFVKTTNNGSGVEALLSKKSVQKDTSKSEVYKSLFSTHATALNKPKGNWVTYDPRYN
jgi:hypothetical protein